MSRENLSVPSLLAAGASASPATGLAAVFFPFVFFLPPGFCETRWIESVASSSEPLLASKAAAETPTARQTKLTVRARTSRDMVSLLAHHS